MKNFLFLVISFLSTIAYSQQAAKTTPPEKTALCVACHGPTGVSPNPIWPTIAGQHADYLEKQLLEFKEGKTRSATVMTGIAASLSQKDIEELAQFYASQPIPTENKTPEKYLKRGEMLYRGGDFASKITACIACHGPDGTGNAQAGFPVLSGQHAQYLIAELEAFKNNERRNDLNHIMQDISMRMKKEDMEAVAYYIQGLY